MKTMITATSRFQVFAVAFIRAYWETLKSGVFSMPPNERVNETVEELLSEILHRTEFREGGLHLLHMEEKTYGAWWRFASRSAGISDLKVELLSRPFGQDVLIRAS